MKTFNMTDKQRPYVLFRIVKETQKNKVAYWSYSVYEEYIHIKFLKGRQEVFTLDSLFFTLIRDVEFVKNYMSDRYTIKHSPDIMILKSKDVRNAYNIWGMTNDGESEILQLKDGDNKITNISWRVPIYILLECFAREYPNLIKFKQNKMQDNVKRCWYTFSAIGETCKRHYKANHNILHNKFKDIDDNYIVSSFKSGFDKNKNVYLIQCNENGESTSNYMNVDTKFWKVIKYFNVIYYKNEYKKLITNEQNIDVRINKIILKSRGC